MYAAAEQDKRYYWVPYFLRERGIRALLHALYTATAHSIPNTELLLNLPPDRIESGTESGSPLARSCFKSVVEWLALAREFAHPEAYERQLLEPLRGSARFLHQARGLGHASTVLKSFVFAVSDKRYSKNFATMVNTLSLLVPELEGAFAISYPSSKLTGINVGGAVIHNVEPIPLVNRLRPYGAILSPDLSASLAALDYLKTALWDVTQFSDSIAIERLCEVQSSQFKRPHLGTVMVIPCRLLSAEVPVMRLQSISNPEYVQDMVVTRTAVEALGSVASLRALKGRLARVLAVTWYTYGTPTENEALPEIFAIQMTDDERTTLVADEVIGHVRIRGKVPAGDLGSRFPELPRWEKINGIVSLGGNAFWTSKAVGKDDVCRTFLDETSRLRDFRSTAPLTQVHFNELFNSDELNAFGYSKSMLRYPKRLEGLLWLIKMADDTDTLPGKVSDIPTIRDASNGDLEPGFRWLRRIGLVVNRGGETILPKIARDAAYYAVRDSLKERIQGYHDPSLGNGLSLIKVSEVSNQSVSLVYTMLCELEKAGQARRLVTDEGKSELFWMRSLSSIDDAETERKLREADRALLAAVLEVLGSVYHALAPSAITERFAANGRYVPVFALLLALRELSRSGRIAQDGRMWVYPWKSRISDFLHKRPYDSFTVEQIASMVLIPLTNSDEILGILKELEKSGTVRESSPGRFILRFEKEKDQIHQFDTILAIECERYLLKLQREERGHISDARLWFEARHFFTERMGEVACPADSIDRIASEAIRSLKLPKSDAEI